MRTELTTQARFFYIIAKDQQVKNDQALTLYRGLIDNTPQCFLWTLCGFWFLSVLKPFSWTRTQTCSVLYNLHTQNPPMLKKVYS